MLRFHHAYNLGAHPWLERSLEEKELWSSSDIHSNFNRCSQEKDWLMMISLTIVDCPLSNPLFFRNNYSDDVVLQRVSVNEALGDHRWKLENLFYLFRGYVFTLRELENIFASVNNTNRSIWINNANITCLEPTFFVKSLACLVLTFIVALENGRALEANLTPRVGYVCRHITHFRQVLKSYFNSFYWTTDMSSYRVRFICDTWECRWLC